MRNLTHRKTQSGHFFPKLWHFFVNLEKWKGETSPPLVLCARWCSTALMVRDGDELFLCLVDRRKAFSLISSRDHCQRSSPLQISNMLQAGFEPAQNLVQSGLVEWSCAVVNEILHKCQLFLEINGCNHL